MEEKIAKITSNLFGGSFIVVVLGLFVLGVISSLTKGEFGIFQNTFIQKILVITVLYSISIYLLSSLPGKSTKRRFWSWLYSVVFHAGLLLYLSVVEELGTIIMIAGFIETIVLFLSILGLCTLLYKVYITKRYNKSLNQIGAKDAPPG